MFLFCSKFWVSVSSWLDLPQPSHARRSCLPPHRRAMRDPVSGKRADAAMEKAFHEQGIMIRVTGYTIALSPPLVVSEDEIAEIFAKVGKVIEAVR